MEINVEFERCVRSGVGILEAADETGFDAEKGVLAEIRIFSVEDLCRQRFKTVSRHLEMDMGQAGKAARRVLPADHQADRLSALRNQTGGWCGR